MYLLLLGRNCLWVIKRALVYFVVVAIVRYFLYFFNFEVPEYSLIHYRMCSHCLHLTCRSAPLNSNLTLAGPLEGNRKLCEIFVVLESSRSFIFSDGVCVHWQLCLHLHIQWGVSS